MPDQTAPIIIKRKKVIAGGHHGGAWKVAIWLSPILWRLFALVSETSFRRANHSDAADRLLTDHAPPLPGAVRIHIVRFKKV